MRPIKFVATGPCSICLLLLFLHQALVPAGSDTRAELPSAGRLRAVRQISMARDVGTAYLGCMRVEAGGYQGTCSSTTVACGCAAADTVQSRMLADDDGGASHVPKHDLQTASCGDCSLASSRLGRRSPVRRHMRWPCERGKEVPGLQGGKLFKKAFQSSKLVTVSVASACGCAAGVLGLRGGMPVQRGRGRGEPFNKAGRSGTYSEAKRGRAEENERTDGWKAVDSFGPKVCSPDQHLNACV